VNKYVISNYIDRLWKYNTECNFNLFSLLTKKYCIWSVILYHQPFICHFNFIWYHTLKSKMSQRKYSGKQYLCTFCIVKGTRHASIIFLTFMTVSSNVLPVLIENVTQFLTILTFLFIQVKQICRIFFWCHSVNLDLSLMFLTIN
jgi:hypothetical protein